MIEILVYTTPEVLEHKKRDGKKSEGCYCYWEFPRPPKKIVDLIKKKDISPVERIVDFEKGEVRLYFATKGFIHGFFDVHILDCVRIIYGELQFYSETWTPINPIPQKPFQGFKYLQLKGAKP